jgi:hypothetical protein
MVVNDKELQLKMKDRLNSSRRTVFIDPLGNFIRLWRLLNSVLLIYNAIATPYRVAFHSTRSSKALITFEIFTDIVFLLDIMVSNFTPYQRIDGSYEENLRKIARRYTQQDLFFDTIAVFPTVLFE